MNSPPRPVVLESFSEQRYALAGLEAHLTIEELEDDRQAAEPVDHGLDVPTRIARAMSWLEQQPPAFDDDPTYYRVCCAVAVGHDLDIEDALTALRPWNARCVPPASDHYLRIKLRNAIRYAKGRRGAMLRAFPNSESGDAEVFAMYGTDVVRYDHHRNRWFIIERETGIWIPDGDGFITELMKNLMRQRQKIANDIKDKEQRESAWNWAFKGESRSRLANALTLAQSARALAVGGYMQQWVWDQDPWILGCQNGVVDLRSGELRRARPDEMVR